MFPHWCLCATDVHPTPSSPRHFSGVSADVRGTRGCSLRDSAGPPTGAVPPSVLSADWWVCATHTSFVAVRLVRWGCSSSRHIHDSVCDRFSPPSVSPWGKQRGFSGSTPMCASSFPGDVGTPGNGQVGHAVDRTLVVHFDNCRPQSSISGHRDGAAISTPENTHLRTFCPPPRRNPRAGSCLDNSCPCRPFLCFSCGGTCLLSSWHLVSSRKEHGLPRPGWATVDAAPVVGDVQGGGCPFPATRTWESSVDPCLGLCFQKGRTCALTLKCRH